MNQRRTPIQEMPVVILCGGKGMRLREETEHRPKPMVKIGDQPILWHIMKTYGFHGLERFVLCLGYKGWIIKEYFLRYLENLRDFTINLESGEPPLFHNRKGDEAWKVTCAETGQETLTGSRLWRVREYLDKDTFLFTYGDCVGNVDIEALVDFHYSQGRIATVTGVHPRSRYGEITVDGSQVTEFNEKPTVSEGVVSGGYFVFQREVFDYLDDRPDIYLEQEPLQRLARDGQLSVYSHDGWWFPMDTYRDYVYLNKLWSAGEAPWRVWQNDH